MKKVSEKILNFVLYFVAAVLLLKLFFWALAMFLEMVIAILKFFA
jgi:hypothetical protein